jgi:hypothetical protein
LNVLFLDGFESLVTPADQFAILTAATLSGAFANAADGTRVITQDGRGSFLIDYPPTTLILKDFQPVAVPEPAALATLALCAAHLATRRPHRR